MNYINIDISVSSTQGVSKTPLKFTICQKRDTTSGIANA